MKQFPLKKKKETNTISLIYRLLKDKLMKIFKRQTHRYIHQTRLAVGKQRGKRQDRGRELRGTTHYVENK